MDTDQLNALTGAQLVEMVRDDDSFFKRVGAELQRRPPDPHAAGALIAAYREGRTPPWLTAYLLVCLRAPRGYDVAREILLAAPRLLAESYAGPAMARIGGAAAQDDLEHLMMTAPHLRSREGAAGGLGVLELPGTASVMLRALQARRVRAQTVASIVARLPDALPVALDWFSSADETLEALAFDVAFSLTARTTFEPDTQLAWAIRRALDGGRVKVSPRIRQAMLERVAPVLRGRT